MSESPILKRPLPSFEQWLTDNGDGSRGEGFDAFMDWASRTIEQRTSHLDFHAAALGRMLKGLVVATVEVCNIEHRNGLTPDQVVQLMPRAMACAAFYATASILQAGTPWRPIAKILSEEFRFAAKEAADQMTKAEDRGAAAP
jgi:hypothetical protein